MQLNRNPKNYFAETEQVMVRPLRLDVRPHRLTIPVPTWPHCPRC
jgi:hypothetical protein